MSVSRVKAIFVGFSLVILGLVVACGESATPAPAPTVDTEAISQAVAAALAALPTPEPGADVPSAEDIAAQVQAAVQADLQTAIAAAIAAIPTPQVDFFGTLNVGVVDLGSNINLLHNQPLSAFRFDNLVTHENMFATTPDNQVENRLVESWSVDSTGLVTTLNLRQGVPWHGVYGEYNADDFIYSINDVVAAGSPHAASGFMRRIWTCDGCELVKIDSHTVQLTRPSPTFQITWHSRTPRSGSVMALHSKALFDALGEDADSESIGTGPWKQTGFKSSISRTVEAVSDHWRKTPNFEEMIWWEIQETATRVANFLVGRIDTGQFTIDAIDTLKRENPEGLKFLDVPGGATLYLNFLGQQYQTDHPAHLPDAEGNVRVPLGDNSFDCSIPYVSCDATVGSAEWEKARKFRLALSLGLDREKLVNNLAFGEGKPWAVQWWLGQDFRLQQFGLDTLSYDYDPVRARELLVEAGYDGEELTLARSEGFFPGVLPVIDAVGVMWEEIGINTTSFNMPFSAYRPSLVNRTAKAVHPLGDNPSLSPLATYNLFFAPTSGLNLGFEHPFMTDKLEEAAAILDDDARWAVLAEIAQWMFDNVMVLPLYNQATIAPLGPKIDKWDLQALGSNLLNNYEFVPHRQ